MRTQRQLKVGEEIRHVLAQLFQRGDVPWPRDFVVPIVTISEVQVSPDLRNATAFFTILGSGDGKLTRRTLNDMAGFFRRELARTVKLRFVPKVDFKIDTSFDYATNIDKILSKPEVARDLDKEDQTIDVDALEDHHG